MLHARDVCKHNDVTVAATRLHLIAADSDELLRKLDLNDPIDSERRLHSTTTHRLIHWESQIHCTSLGCSRNWSTELQNSLVRITWVLAHTPARRVEEAVHLHAGCGGVPQLQRTKLQRSTRSHLGRLDGGLIVGEAGPEQGVGVLQLPCALVVEHAVPCTTMVHSTNLMQPPTQAPFQE